MSPWEGGGEEGEEGRGESPGAVRPGSSSDGILGGSADCSGAGLGPAEEADKSSLSKTWRGDVQTQMKQVPAWGKRADSGT